MAAQIKNIQMMKNQYCIAQCQLIRMHFEDQDSIEIDNEVIQMKIGRCTASIPELYILKGIDKCNSKMDVVADSLCIEFRVKMNPLEYIAMVAFTGVENIMPITNAKLHCTYQSNWDTEVKRILTKYHGESSITSIDSAVRAGNRKKKDVNINAPIFASEQEFIVQIRGEKVFNIITSAVELARYNEVRLGLSKYLKKSIIEATRNFITDEFGYANSKLSDAGKESSFDITDDSALQYVPLYVTCGRDDMIRFNDNTGAPMQNDITGWMRGKSNHSGIYAIGLVARISILELYELQKLASHIIRITAYGDLPRLNKVEFTDEFVNCPASADYRYILNQAALIVYPDDEMYVKYMLTPLSTKIVVGLSITFCKWREALSDFYDTPKVISDMLKKLDSYDLF